MWRTPLHPERVLLPSTEHLGQPKSVPVWGQLADKPQGGLPATVPRRRCAGADGKIVPLVCQLLRINTINLWQSFALILPVNSLSLLQHIGCPSPHLGNSSAVCLEVALCVPARAGEGGGRAAAGAESGVGMCGKGRWLQDGELQLPAGSTRHPIPWQLGLPVLGSVETPPAQGFSPRAVCWSVSCL